MLDLFTANFRKVGHFHWCWTSSRQNPHNTATPPALMILCLSYVYSFLYRRLQIVCVPNVRYEQSVFMWRIYTWSVCRGDFIVAVAVIPLVRALLRTWAGFNSKILKESFQEILTKNFKLLQQKKTFFLITVSYYFFEDFIMRSL